jgi:excisionase family DNA binding protein
MTDNHIIRTAVGRTSKIAAAVRAEPCYQQRGWIMGDTLTVKDVANFLKLDKRLVYQLAREGKLPSFKIGRQWRFRKEQIQGLFQMNWPAG